jgi:uncharacterized DUF497 family protein
MEYEFDPDKAAANLAKHGVSFEEMERFEWDTAVSWEDTRYEYGETRKNALGYIGNRIHLVSYTERAGQIRLINVRKANSREVKRYAET